MISAIRIIKEKIETVATTPSAVKSQTMEKEKIVNSYNSWVNKFLANPEKEELLIKENELINRKLEYNLNKEYRDKCKFFFNTVRDIVNSYNTESNNKIVIKESIPFPKNIFQSGDQYKMTVEFPDSVKWKIILVVFSDSLIHIYWEISSDDQDAGDIRIMFHLNMKEEFRISSAGTTDNFRYKNMSFPTGNIIYRMKDYKNVINGLLTSIFKYEFIQIRQQGNLSK